MTRDWVAGDCAVRGCASPAVGEAIVGALYGPSDEAYPFCAKHIAGTGTRYFTPKLDFITRNLARCSVAGCDELAAVTMPDLPEPLCPKHLRIAATWRDTVREDEP